MVSILMSAGTIIMYFFLSLFVPFLTYLIPYYKITKVNLYKKKILTSNKYNSEFGFI